MKIPLCLSLYDKDTAEFTRVLNLGDAVFAITMLLLVIIHDIPDIMGTELARTLAEQLTQFIAFILSFILIDIIWAQR